MTETDETRTDETGSDEWDDVIREAGGLAVEIAVAVSARPLSLPIGEIVADSILAANGVVGPAQGVVSIRVDTDKAVRALNKQWRGQDKPTNVLSFPSPATAAAPPGAIMLGDIAISYETTAREAEAEGKAFRDHLAHLSIHGFLHLLGYDHESDQEAEAMEQVERAILAHLGITDPYIARGTAD